ncbi:MAG: hypothetical protein ACOYB0_08360 [Polynucleobacter sp.]
MRRSKNFKEPGPVDLPLYLTHDDIAAVLHVGERHVKDVIVKGPTFPAPREATGVKLYPRLDFLRWLESHRKAEPLAAPTVKPKPIAKPAPKKRGPKRKPGGSA